MNRAFAFFLSIAGLAALLGPNTARAQNLDPGSVWLYNHIDGSQLVDDCPVCDRIPIVEPIRGTFELRVLENSPLATTFAIANINFTNSGTLNRTYQVTGNGFLNVSGEVAIKLNLYLKVFINNGITNQLCYFDTNWAGFNRPWPMFQASVDQTNGTPAQQFHLDLNAAPFREIWFSTSSNFSAGISNEIVSSGDLLSNKGRRVKANTQLTSPFVLMPPAPDLGLKDFDILPGGEVAFSVEQQAFSEKLGLTLHSGDLLSAQGTILRTNPSLIAAFQPQSTTDAGLGAVQVMSANETWFSVQTNFFSKALNTLITPGDLLSDSGTIIRSNAQLISRFRPAEPSTNAGLKAVYVWPNGEIWFCIGSGFKSADSLEYTPGDVLSDQGYVVFRNSELLAVFAPTTTTNVAADGLWVVTDVITETRPPVLAPPLPQPTNSPPTATLRWVGPGRVFQLERATNVSGPYLPASPIQPDMTSTDATGLTNSTRNFYRVRQW